MIWDKIESHHKMQHSPAYGPFRRSMMPILSGDIEIAHMEINDCRQLKKALEMPVTQISHVKIEKDKVAEALELHNKALKNIEEELHCMSMMYSYEDPYVPPRF